MQPNAVSVQQKLNEAFEQLYQQIIETTGSGRTDTGVHARQQVFHVDLPERYSVDELKYKLNGVLPKDIVIDSVYRVKAEAHARFSAISRTYEYHISFRKSPFSQNESYYLPRPPDSSLINKGCEILIGTHDFASFSKVKTDVSNFNCTINEAKWQQTHEKAIFDVSANRFLRGMVRAMVGTLLDLGFAKISIEEFKAIIDTKNRMAAGQSVPPQGLYLCEVRYPEDIRIIESS